MRYSSVAKTWRSRVATVIAAGALLALSGCAGEKGQGAASSAPNETAGASASQAGKATPTPAQLSEAQTAQLAQRIKFIYTPDGFDKVAASPAQLGSWHLEAQTSAGCKLETYVNYSPGKAATQAGSAEFLQSLLAQAKDASPAQLAYLYTELPAFEGAVYRGYNYLLTSFTDQTGQEVSLLARANLAGAKANIEAEKTDLMQQTGLRLSCPAGAGDQAAWKAALQAARPDLGLPSEEQGVWPAA